MTLNHFGHRLVKLTSSSVHISFHRLYARWGNRQASRVLLPTLPSEGSSLKKDEVIVLDPEILRMSREAHAAKVGLAKMKKEPKEKNIELQKETQASEQQILKSQMNSDDLRERRVDRINRRKNLLLHSSVYDENGELVYEKLGENDGRVSTILTKLKSKKQRYELNQVLVEGCRLIIDGIQSNCQLRYLIFSRITDLDPIKPYLPLKGVKLYKIPYKEIELWSDVVTSTGILGIFDMPTHENIKRTERPLPLNIIVDNVRDPGNLGALLRVCVGAGCNKVLLMKGCVDLWNPKVVRSAAGAHFLLPVHNSIEWTDVKKYIQPNSSVFIADNNTQEAAENSERILKGLNVPVIPYYSAEYADFSSITLIIGGETEGISEESYRYAANANGLRINIPLQKGVDSLNTGMAAAVIAFEVKKQILEARARRRNQAAILT